jgi:uncharacterized protein involved in exopolysaccharide biosynthesis
MEEKELTVKELLLELKEWKNYFWSLRKKVFLIGILGLILGAGYGFFKKPTYNALLTFALEDEKSNSMSGALSIASQFGVDLGGAKGSSAFSGPNLLELMKSRVMVEKALLSPYPNNPKQTLIEYYIDQKEWRKDWENGDNEKLKKCRFPVGANRAAFNQTQDSILGVLHKTLTEKALNVERKVKLTTIVSVEFSDKDEFFAKYFTEALTENVSQFYIETRSKKARTNYEVLKKQTDSVRTELTNAIKGVATSNDAIFGLNPAMNVKRVPSVNRQVDVQANTAILTELVKNLELAKVDLRKETPLIQIIDTPLLPLPYEKLGILKGGCIGGFLFGFFALLYFGVKRYWGTLMNS